MRDKRSNSRNFLSGLKMTAEWKNGLHSVVISFPELMFGFLLVLSLHVCKIV